VARGHLHGTLQRWYGSVWTDLRYTREHYVFVFEPNSQLQRLGPGVPTDYARWMHNLRADLDAGLRAVR
jgi:hypothetical protein